MKNEGQNATHFQMIADFDMRPSLNYFVELVASFLSLPVMQEAMLQCSCGGLKVGKLQTTMDIVSVVVSGGVSACPPPSITTLPTSLNAFKFQMV